jgi:nitroimidazol reductase NimA-like FMN-containing flavoprotein (pyridoxamine 5'-phosphate oxidase superfamily)
MAPATETAMSDAEIDAFLGRNETGVLSLAREGEPYSVPVSYGYDATARTVYLRLVSTPGSRKRAFLDTDPAATLVVYDEGDADETTYRSVVVAGTLAEINPDSLSVEQIQQYGEARRPLFEIWGQEKSDLDIRLYELVPAELTGRQTVVER